jgi:hypothetical protein
MELIDSKKIKDKLLFWPAKKVMAQMIMASMITLPKLSYYNIACKKAQYRNKFLFLDLKMMNGLNMKFPWLTA